MKIDASMLHKIAPSLRRALLLTLIALSLSIGLVFFLILPAHAQLALLTNENNTLKEKIDSVRDEIASTDKQQETNAAKAAECDTILASGVIEPLLGSFAMRAKSLLDPIAHETGFIIETVKELPLIPLQVPNPAPLQLYGRQPVELSGRGSYAQLTAFVSSTERALPLATLSSLLVLSQPQSPETHKVLLTFEWPAKGEKRKPDNGLK